MKCPCHKIHCLEALGTVVFFETILWFLKQFYVLSNYKTMNSFVTKRQNKQMPFIVIIRMLKNNNYISNPHHYMNDGTQYFLKKNIYRL